MKTQDINKLDLIIYNAFNQNVNEIHIEPNSADVTVRYRFDGILKIGERFDFKTFEKLLEQLKIMAGLSTTAKTPQAGRILLSISDKKLDLRTSVIPSCNGDSICIRLLNLEKSKSFDINNIHLSDTNLKTLKRWYSKPSGMIIASGFTGSGKTTLLYSILNELNKESVKICTVEDPIEFQVDGITQTAVNVREGMTFSSTARALLRQSPDIIYISEIRDSETLNIAANCAITGHLLLGSMYAENAISTIFRIKDMGIAPFLIRDCLSGVITQRLVRKLCPDCRESYNAETFEFKGLQIPDTTYYKAHGCEKCHNLGYQGLIPICEFFEFSSATAQMFINGCTEKEITEKAVSEGMKTFFDEAITMAVEGSTSLEEISRVLCS